MLARKKLPRIVFVLLSHCPVWLQRLLFYLASPKYTAGVSAIIVDQEHRILVLHHTYRHPAWGLPSGLVRRDEEPEETITREIREELGVSAVVESLERATLDRRYRHITLHFRVHLLGAPAVTGPEVDELKFVSIDEMRRLTGFPIPSWMEPGATC